MDKIDIEFKSESRQCTGGYMKQGICGAIIRRSEPFALEDSSECLGNVKIRTVRREERYAKNLYKLILNVYLTN